MKALSGAAAVALFATTALATVRAHDPVRTRVTWNGEIGRIVRTRCISCHSEGGRAPMPLTTYREARPWARAIREEVLTRRMPMWHAARGYGAFSNDPSLSPFEIALITAWVDGGAPEGTPVERPDDPGNAIPPQPADPPGTREIVVLCGAGLLPEGTLLAFRPMLSPGATTGFSVRLPDRRVEVLGWIRDFDPDFAATYRLRTPLPLPRGTHLISMSLRRGGTACSLALTMAPPPR
jgi:hypothetical protein